MTANRFRESDIKEFEAWFASRYSETSRISVWVSDYGRSVEIRAVMPSTGEESVIYQGGAPEA